MKIKNIKFFARKGKLKISLLVAFIVSASFVTVSNSDFQIVKNMDIFFSLFREVSLLYVDETDPEKLINSGIEGMLQTLDPYTVFIPESSMEEYRTATTGQYGGVGMTISNINNAMTIVEISHNNSADRAGLRVGDVITKINGISLNGKNEQETNDLLNGAPNSKLSVTFVQTRNRREVTRELTREIITIPNVPY